MRIGIVGHGVVGSAMARCFRRQPKHEVVIYDKFRFPYDGINQRSAVNCCDLVFVCVPTPTAGGGFSCDVSAVEECVEWIEPPICLRSTVVPGTVDRLTLKTGKSISFSPEYLGEAQNHPWHEEGACGFLIVGGPSASCDLLVSAYSEMPDLALRYFRTTARTAELCKYMENCFLATKVAFVNQFYDIAAAFDVDFGELRDLWLADPRVGPSHSAVTEERGFRGRCLPKDLAAMIAVMRLKGGAPLLTSVLDYNTRLCESVDQRRVALKTES